jgi:hypothetical protein
MKKQKILVEKGNNAKIVFNGYVVEVKKTSENEVELTFPGSLPYEELVSYLESFGVIKRKNLTTGEDVGDSGVYHFDNENVEKAVGQSEGGSNLQVSSTEDAVSFEEWQEKEKPATTQKRKRKTK